ncbi:GNAT family N-acetyltransferase [Glycomyces algeriensis]|uniref:N-acetyltransferase n=1 Tax=Glycomyces algeriensis TaxID=256037 RepID=A0A9W6LFR5_9ACTN|nr:GNAT family N-acetyltransferase [Glycomyces algeriensis]MDA1366040.1 GNAT family N-acetyltransferase [Glycomyces algeriensis]MDR7349193.1 N-acetylglutamate synthase-like GNAT family acetyltransferase [Glycomyces algeriensis]GLI41893.1 N-acetyltransferase [Glycomyces algeriensis]
MSDAYTISSDPDRLDRAWIHQVISTDTYWATGRTRERSDLAIDHSLPFGLYDADGRQLAFARLVTDHAYFGWLSDVYVDREARGKGLSKRLVAHILDEAERMGLKRVLLATADAQGLYRQFGFEEIDDDFSWMYRVRPAQP